MSGDGQGKGVWRTAFPLAGSLSFARNGAGLRPF